MFSVFGGRPRARAIHSKSGSAHGQRTSGFPLLSLAEVFLEGFLTNHKID